jgi:hypothetical protein
MKNSKLLLTSALVGSVALGAVANAETKISGGASYTYAWISGDDKAANDQGAGKEVQLDISNSATLENGLGFSAGFSLEQDGNQAAFDGSEGNFMKFTSGNTSVMWNVDKAMNISQSATPRVTADIGNISAGMGTTAYAYGVGGQSQQGAWNLEFAQKIDSGTIALVYTPRIGDKGGANDNIDTADVKKGTATDVIYRGNAGIDGLSVVAGWSQTDAISSTLSDTDVKQLGIGYNFGKFAVGVTQADTDTSDGTSDTQREYGITYSVADNLSLGIQHVVTDNNEAENENINVVALGYNLGAVSVEAYYVDVTNIGGSATAANVDKVGIAMRTKF